MSKQDSDLSIPETIKAIRKAAHCGAKSDLGHLLAELRVIEPHRWLSLLLENNVLPEPDSSTFSNVIHSLLAGLQTTRAKPDPRVDETKELSSFLNIHTCLLSIKDELGQLGIWRKPGIVPVVTTAAYVEDQTRIYQGELMATARSRGFYDLTTVMTETYDTEVGNAHTSLQGGYEWFCETLQLILAHAMETFDSEFYGAVDSATSPYQNSDFERLMLLATLWRIYKDLWARIKLLGWRAVELSDPDARTCYRPPNLDEFMLHQVGSYRNVQLTSEFQAQLITQVLPDTASDNPELIDKIAVSINVPMFGEAWDGQIDLPSMILATKFTGAEATALVALSEFHYSELAGDVKIVRPMYQETTWKTYIKAMGVIRVLSEAFRRAIQKRAKEREPSPLETVALVKRTDLVELISKSKAMGTTESIAAVRALMFEPGFSHLEIWDTPLIPADNDSVLIVPSIIGAGSPVRAIENIIAQWNDHLFTDRGRILERRIKSIFSDVAGVQVQGRVVFHNLDGTEVECDLVVWWGGYLILIEAKCTKSVYNPADLFRAHHRLADAIDQLNVRLEAVTQNWSGFKSAASQLDLPDSPPPAEKVVLIAATNVTHCTGEFRNQVRILDEHVIARFFGSKDIAVSDGVQQLHVVDHIRSSDDPSVEEFLSY